MDIEIVTKSIPNAEGIHEISLDDSAVPFATEYARSHPKGDEVINIRFRQNRGGTEMDIHRFIIPYQRTTFGYDESQYEPVYIGTVKGNDVFWMKPMRKILEDGERRLMNYIRPVLGK